MKQTISKLLLLCTIIFTLQACHHEPYYTNGYIHSETVQKRVTNGVSGKYVGKLQIFHELASGKNGSKIIENYQYTVGGYDNQTIILHKFPINLIAESVVDSNLAAAIKQLSDTDIPVLYRVSDADDTESESDAGVYFTIPPFAQTLNYGGQEHHVTVHFKTNSWLGGIDADKEDTWKIDVLQFVIDKISVDGTTYQQYSDWAEAANRFYVVLRGKKV